MSRSRKFHRLSSKTRPCKLNFERLEDRTVLATMVGLSHKDHIVTFDSTDPVAITSDVVINGLGQGEDMIGITTRPATGELYGLTNAGRIYTIDAFTGTATFKSALTADVGDTTAAFTSLQGNSFEIDFNPVLDRMRIVSDGDQNLRVDVDTGATFTDTNLDYLTGDVNFGRDAHIVGSGYTNPDNNNGTATVLYGIDSRFDTLVTQNPANNGTLTTIGSLGLNTNTRVGFDVGLDGVGYAVLTPAAGGANNGADSALYTINLSTGAATLVGKVGGGGYTLLNVQTMLPARPIYAVNVQGELISYNAARPDLITSRTQISGLDTGETIVNLDFRPSTGQLYAMSSTGRIYTIDTKTGAAVATPSLRADPGDASNPFAALTGGSFGFNFDPVTDRLNLTSNLGENLTTNVGSGNTTTNTALAFGVGDVNFGTTANIVASAFSNNFPGTGTSTMFGIDSNLNALVTQNGATGTLSTIGNLGFDVSDVTSFDITSDGVGYLGLNLPGGTNSGFYSIDLATGAATLLGTIGATSTVGGETIAAMAITPPLVQFANSFFGTNQNVGVASAGVIRTGDTTSNVNLNFNASSTEATAGVDFTPVSGSLAFNAGTATQAVKVGIINDQIMGELAERIDLSLSNPAGGGGGTLGTNMTSGLTIAADV